MIIAARVQRGSVNIAAARNAMAAKEARKYLVLILIFLKDQVGRRLIINAPITRVHGPTSHGERSQSHEVSAKTMSGSSRRPAPAGAGIPVKNLLDHVGKEFSAEETLKIGRAHV